jgi:hypothetical protein
VTAEASDHIGIDGVPISNRCQLQYLSFAQRCCRLGCDAGREMLGSIAGRTNQENTKHVNCKQKLAAEDKPAVEILRGISHVAWQHVNCSKGRSANGSFSAPQP